MTDPYVRVWPGANRPALALHCTMASSSYWGPIAASLSDLVTMTAPDMPGHGMAPDWQGGPPDFHTAVTRRAAALIDRPVDLMGHSLGATVALRIAVAAPEAVRSLTLIEPVLFAATPDHAPDPMTQEVVELVAQGRDAEAACNFITGWGAMDWNAQSDETKARMASQMKLVADSADTLSLDAANILRDGGLEAIDAPVMIVMGDRTLKSIPAIADALAARMQDVGRAIIPDAGHVLPITHPKQVADVIRINLERA